MLVIESKFPKPIYVYGGGGLLDIAKNILHKSANSSIGQKVINSATTKNLQKAANSTIGKEIQKQVKTGIAEGAKSVVTASAEKLGLPVSNKRRKRTSAPSKAKKKKGSGIIWE